METENKDKAFPEVLYDLKKNGMDVLQAVIRQCGRDELEDIIRLQSAVHDAVADKDTFVFSTEDELAESLDTDVCIGAYLDGRLIAFTLIVTNPCSPRNLGYYLDYSRERCQKCVTYDTTFVHPSYTGYGLQRAFLSIKEAIAIDLGAWEALATVSPDNAVSLRNLRAGGFEIAGEKSMYGERRRYIMRKSLIKD